MFDNNKHNDEEATLTLLRFIISASRFSDLLITEPAAELPKFFKTPLKLTSAVDVSFSGRRVAVLHL